MRWRRRWREKLKKWRSIWMMSRDSSDWLINFTLSTSLVDPGTRRTRQNQDVRYVSGRMLRKKLAGDRCTLKHRGWQGIRNDLLRALRRDGHRIMRWTPLFPRGAGPQKSWARGVRTFLPKIIQRNDGPPARSLRPGSTTLTLNFCGVREVTFPEWGAETRLGLLPTAAPRPVSSMGKCRALGLRGDAAMEQIARKRLSHLRHHPITYSYSPQNIK